MELFSVRVVAVNQPDLEQQVKQNRMNSTRFEAFSEQLCDFILRSTASFCSSQRAQADTGDEFNDLAVKLFEIQYQSVSAYRRWCDIRGKNPGNVKAWDQVPAVPTAAFKELDMTAIEPAQRTTVFYSSGTTMHRPSKHWHSPVSIKTYERSLLAWFRPHMMPEIGSDQDTSYLWLALTPPPNLAPHSSLVHMLGTVMAEFGGKETVFAGQPAPDNIWLLDHEKACKTLERAAMVNTPVCILTTAFHCVELMEYLDKHKRAVRLPPKSRIMETGGYKGRSRQIPKKDLLSMARDLLGIEPSYCISEYGMTELSSQAYDLVAGSGNDTTDVEQSLAQRCFRFPPWARIRIVSPETGRPVTIGEPGLLQVYDLANVYSVMAVQTEDLVVPKEDGFQYINRSPGAEQRGCSLMAK